MFRLNYIGPKVHVTENNLKSACEHHGSLLDKVNQEIISGRIMDQFHQLPIVNLHLFPVGLVRKSDGGWRMIAHLSYPSNTCSGMNSFIDPDLCTVQYASFDGVADMIFKLGRGALIGKIYIKSVFRLVPVNPADFDLLGFQFMGSIILTNVIHWGVL